MCCYICFGNTTNRCLHNEILYTNSYYPNYARQNYWNLIPWVQNSKKLNPCCSIRATALYVKTLYRYFHLDFIKICLRTLWMAGKSLVKLPLLFRWRMQRTVDTALVVFKDTRTLSESPKICAFLKIMIRLMWPLGVKKHWIEYHLYFAILLNILMTLMFL